jgi:hypothetical protein
MSQNVWATIMPFGPVTNFLLAPNFFFYQKKNIPPSLSKKINKMVIAIVSWYD